MPDGETDDVARHPGSHPGSSLSVGLRPPALPVGQLPPRHWR